MMQIPDAAVHAAKDWIENSEPIDIEGALRAALPHLPLGFEVRQLKWVDDRGDAFHQETHFGRYRIWKSSLDGKWCWALDGFRFSHGFEEAENQAKAAAQADFERRVRECCVPRPDIKTIIDEIRAGTRQGFLNEGDQPEESDAELSCPYCGGSGHIDDIATKPVDVAAVLSGLLSAQTIKDIATEYLSHRGENPWKVKRGGYELWEAHVPAIKSALEFAIRALSAEPAQGKVEPCGACGDPECDFDCDGDYGAPTSEVG